jgi:hypothetical protein
LLICVDLFHVSHQPPASPSPPAADVYPADDDHLEDEPVLVPLAGPSSSQPFAYHESQAVVSKAASQLSDEMDVIGNDTSAADVLDVIGPDTSVLPMPSPLADVEEQDEVEKLVQDGSPPHVGQVVVDSVPLAKTRVSTSLRMMDPRVRLTVYACLFSQISSSAEQKKKVSPPIRDTCFESGLTESPLSGQDRCRQRYR